MKRVLTAVAMGVVLVAGPALAEAPYLVAWSRQIGTSSDDYSYSVAVDASGNAYISGYTWGSLGGPNAGVEDALLAKYDGSGNLLWSRQIGTNDHDLGRAVAVDASGNVYISGWTYGSLGGTNAGYADAFLTKYDGSGNLLWSRQIGTNGYDGACSVAADASGNAYISGWTSGSLGGPIAGSYDAFLTKYDGSGNLLWSRQIGTSSFDESWSVAVDASGNTYISGDTQGSLGGPNAGSSDAFLSKYDGSGNLLWARQIGTSDIEVSYAVAVDASGNAYISGYTNGSFGGPWAGGWDAFLSKYADNGTLLWTRQIATSGNDYSQSVAVDTSGNAYISGYTTGSLGGPNAGSYDAFLTKFDASGNLLWTRQIGTGGEDRSYSVAVDASGNAFISGYTDGNLAGPNAGGWDAFLVKLKSPPGVIVEGTVVPIGYLGDVTDLGVRIAFKQAGAVVQTEKISLSTNGTFAVSDVVPGTYDVSIKIGNWLEEVKHNVVISDNSTNIGIFQLRGADANGDDHVDFADFSMLQNNYGQSGGATRDNPLPAEAAIGGGGCSFVGIVLAALLGLGFCSLGLWGESRRS